MHAKSADPHQPAAPAMADDLISPTQLAQIREEKEMAAAREALVRAKKAEEEHRNLRDAFMHQDVRADAKQRFSSVVRRAAENGQHEILALRFPAELCSDGGVAINNFDPNWPRTLQGFAARAYEFFEKELRPLGYKLRAQILNYPGGVLGEVGIYVSW